MKHQVEFIPVTINNCLRVIRVVLVKDLSEKPKASVHPSKQK